MQFRGFARSASSKRRKKSMKLSKLLERLDYTCLQGDMNKEITGIYNDSRKVTDGSLFLCIKGAVS